MLTQIISNLIWVGTVTSSLRLGGSMPHQCSEDYVNHLECTSTYIDHMPAFNASFTLGNAVQSYNIYPIYLGSWTKEQRKIIAHFLSHVGESAWYYAMMNRPASTNLLKYQGDTVFTSTDTRAAITSMGHLSYDGDGESWVSNFISKFQMSTSHFTGTFDPDNPSGSDVSVSKKYEYPLLGTFDGKGIYMILLGQDATIPLLHSTSYRNPTWYSDFCGTHTMGIDHLQVLSGLNKKRYIIVQYPTAQTNAKCIPQKMTKSPNNDAGLDALINIISHELIETTSGYDIGNQCVYQFGNIQTEHSTGAQYTQKIGDLKYFIQQNYNYFTQKCTSGEINSLSKSSSSKVVSHKNSSHSKVVHPTPTAHVSKSFASVAPSKSKVTHVASVSVAVKAKTTQHVSVKAKTTQHASPSGVVKAKPTQHASVSVTVKAKTTQHASVNPKATQHASSSVVLNAKDSHVTASVSVNLKATQHVSPSAVAHATETQHASPSVAAILKATEQVSPSVSAKPTQESASIAAHPLVSINHPAQGADQSKPISVVHSPSTVPNSSKEAEKYATPPAPTSVPVSVVQNPPIVPKQNPPMAPASVPVSVAQNPAPASAPKTPQPPAPASVPVSVAQNPAPASAPKTPQPPAPASVPVSVAQNPAPASAPKTPQPPAPAKKM